MADTRSSHHAHPATDDAASVVRNHRECIRCGYNLKGLHLQSYCPECGTPIRASFLSESIRLQRPEIVEKLLGGAKLLLAGVILQLVMRLLMIPVLHTRLFGFTSPADDTAGIAATVWLASAPAALLIFLGWHGLTIEARHDLLSGRLEAVRSLLGPFALIALLIAIGESSLSSYIAWRDVFARDAGPQLWSHLVALTATHAGLSLAIFFLGLAPIRDLAGRLGNLRLVQQVRALAWTSLVQVFVAALATLLAMTSFVHPIFDSLVLLLALGIAAIAFLPLYLQVHAGLYASLRAAHAEVRRLHAGETVSVLGIEPPR